MQVIRGVEFGSVKRRIHLISLDEVCRQGNCVIESPKRHPIARGEGVRLGFIVMRCDGCAVQCGGSCRTRKFLSPTYLLQVGEPKMLAERLFTSHPIHFVLGAGYDSFSPPPFTILSSLSFLHPLCKILTP